MYNSITRVATIQGVQHLNNPTTGIAWESLEEVEAFIASTEPVVTPPPVSNIALYQLSALAIKDASELDILFANGAYQPDKQQEFSISANIIDEDSVVQSALNISNLKLVFIRTANNQHTTDQQLFTCNINNGELMISGAFERTGVWILDVEYNNKALQALGFDFGIEHENLAFWV